jgi:2-dehydro-3-deoxygalactonokinase
MITNSSTDNVPDVAAPQEPASAEDRAARLSAAAMPVNAGTAGQIPPATTDVTELIGVDWGTTNLRIMRIGREGQIIDFRHDERGASRLRRDDFAPILEELAADWLDESVPVLICGMAGSRDGWRETGYRQCPVSLADLRPLDVSMNGVSIAIVPGVSLVIDGELADVMRGEETQVMGLSDCRDDAVIVTPGTHSKWIHCSDGSIVSFRSFLTGDLFSAIRAETLIGHEMGDAGTDPQAFEAGVRRALQDSALTAILFSVRTTRLSGALPATSTADYLSGLLIGAEIAAQQLRPDDPIAVLGTTALGERYAAALAVAGARNVETIDAAAAAARGLWRIHRATQ